MGREDIRIIAGLGNPGRKYEGTRHNIGFMLLDALVSRVNTIGGATVNRTKESLSWQEKFGAEVLSVSIFSDLHKVMLVKPQEFMNTSGVALGRIMRFYKYTPENLVVVHDDIDLPFGSIKIRQNGGEGGHNGVRSVVEQLGTKEFVRLRLGIGRPLASVDARPGVNDWVLSDFDSSEREILPSFLERSAEAVSELCAEGLLAAQNRFN